MSSRIERVLESPGEKLRKELEKRGWTQNELAAMIGRSTQSINDIIASRRSITPDMAVLLEAATGVTARQWLLLEGMIQLEKAKADTPKDQVTKRVELFSLAPVSEMMKRGWIIKTRDPNVIESELLKFYGVGQLEKIGSFAANFKISEAHTPQSAAIAAWLRKVELEASNMPVDSYTRHNIESLVTKLKKSSRKDKPFNTSKAVMAEYGIRLVYEKHLNQTYLDGAALKTNGIPTVAMSLRYNRIDNFVFVLFHELAHVIYHLDSAKNPFWDENPLSRQDLPEERQANYQAEEWLIPGWQYQEFISSCRGKYSKQRIEDFADYLEIDPGVIVGRLQHDRRINYSQFREFLKPVQ